ncbi:GlsB/YeaQ/YmgE family stress response membrane protein [Bdellovibrio bacteriovorus]|uniref:GlsB/YeaQ/YmgE family stress response membrane protein n=1 Tax=Bdellovibrio bacteriovorus TaxID=959 RepID=UPI0035A979A0
MNINSILHHPLFNQFVLWTVLGLGVGVAAKLLIPGSEAMGWIRTILLGLAGSFLGNFLAPRLFHWPTFTAFSWQGILIGIAGAAILVVVNRIVTRS